MMIGEYLKPEVEVVVFDIDDVRMDTLLLSKHALDSKSIFANDLIVDFWDDGM